MHCPLADRARPFFPWNTDLASATSEIEGLRGDVHDIEGFEVERSLAFSLERALKIYVEGLLAPTINSHDGDSG